MVRPYPGVSPIFIVGNPRSGTTLLRVIWNAHPNMVLPHECGFLHELYPKYAELDPFGKSDIDRFLDDIFAVKDFDMLEVQREGLRERLRGLREPAYAHIIDSVYKEFASQHDQVASRWGDKHTHFVAHIPEMASLFPQAKFIHIIRDSRASVASMLNTRLGSFALADGTVYSTHEIVGASKLWRKLVAKGRVDGAHLGSPHYLEIKYEELVVEPERVCREMCDFVEEGFSPAMLDPARQKESSFIPQHRADRYHENIGKKLLTNRVDNWREELSRPQLILIEHLTGDVLEGCGYQRVIEQPRWWESVRLVLRLTFDKPINFARRALRLPRFHPFRTRTKAK